MVEWLNAGVGAVTQKDFSRRSVIAAGVAVAGLAQISSTMAQPAASLDAIIVTFLGTGGPGPTIQRFGPATLVQAGGKTLLFDAGRGCTIRCQQIGVGLAALDGVFLTHFHSDHINGLFDLFTLGYLTRRPPTADPAMSSIRINPLRLWGPTGVAKIAKGFEAAASDDIRIRIADEGVSKDVAKIDVREFAHDGVIFDEGGVQVTAFAVDHGPLIKPAYGYRVDYRGHSVLISGDTRLNENLIAHGADLDLLVHSVAAVSPKWQSNPEARATLAHQSSPEDCATIFTRTKPKMAAFTHIVLIGATPADIVARAETIYNGPMIVGEDLLRFVITGDVVTERWNAETRGYPA